MSGLKLCCKPLWQSGQPPVQGQIGQPNQQVVLRVASHAVYITIASSI